MSTTRRLLTVLGLLFAGGCEPGGPAVDPTDVVANHACKNALPLLTGPGFRGVVMPSDVSRRALRLSRADIEETFRASDDVVRELEAALPGAVKVRLQEAAHQVESPARDRDVARVEHIRQHLAKAVRQYSGVVTSGARRILVNAFPEDAYCYRDEYISMKDGGAQFWRVQYDPTLKQFVHWEVNPD